jgi:uncharacterized membrane protein YkvA (DUF1232 family)
MAAFQLRRRMKSVLMFLPNMVVLCGRLMVDPRVPRSEKILVSGAILYAIMPLDLIPDLLPFIGQVDDAYLIGITLLRLLDRTDESVLREHWRGGGDITALIESVVSLAPKFLPGKVQRILSSRVDEKYARKGDYMARIAEAGPLLVERTGEDIDLNRERGRESRMPARSGKSN